ncbi:tetraspanin-33 [Engraulis encrasicolus]|uniref:tetraspanin-33 n=1 Tax=Engraulis encrasicolus TaxID=184585 RepID=UPI002FD0F08C
MRGYRGIKYTLFICCYIFWVASAVLIAVGIYAKIAKEKDAVDTLTADPALLLIVTGSLMFTITFLGCCGALRNIGTLLKLFSGILLVIFLLQIAAGVLGFLYSDLVLERTEQLMMRAIVRYRDDLDLENVIDFIQKKFQCCGVESHKDWHSNVYFQCEETNPSLEACGVPFSCCRRNKSEAVFNTMCGYETQGMEDEEAREDIFITGCLERIVRWGKNHLFLVGGITIGLVCLELCMICLASAQLSRIKKIVRKKRLLSLRNSWRMQSR